METRTDAYRVLRVTEDGVQEDPVPQIMRGTLFSHLWQPDQAALLRVDTPKGEDSFARETSRMRLAKRLQELPTELAVLGGGNGLKTGKLWSADRRIAAWCRERYFTTSEEALSYGALLFSENKMVVRAPGATLYERGGPDGQGLVDVDWLREHDLLLRQIQIRAAYPDLLVKGTLVPDWGLKARTGQPIAFHATMVKGRGTDLDRPFLLGVRDIAEQRTFRSGWTVTQWLSESVRERLWERYAVDVLRHLEDGFTSCEGALRLLAALPGRQEEARDLTHLLLHSGLEPSHPWLRNNLRKHVRRAYLDTALGLGLPLEGGMACWVPALDDHKVAVPWLPVGAEIVIGRYPVRDACSLRVVRNSCAPVPEGSIGLNETLARQLDGDEDGDYVFAVTDPDCVRAIQELHETTPARLARPAKARRRTPLAGLERTAVHNIGATGIGSPTWLIAAALASDQPGFVPELSDQVQNAVESLKWDTNVDWEHIREIERQVDLPEFLELGQKKRTFLEEAPRIGHAGGFGTFWNRCAEHFERHVLEGTKKLADFRDLVPSPDGSCIAEAQVVRDYYHGAILGSNGDDDAIHNAVKLVRAWGAGKREDRLEYAKTCWHLGHKSSHPRATASFALHPFPEELAELLGIPRDRCAEVLPPALPGLKVEVEAGALHVNERRMEFAPLAYGRPDAELSTTLVPVVGGWRGLAEHEGLDEDKAVQAMRGLVDGWRGRKVSLLLRLEDVAWTDRPVLNAYVGGQLLGCVAPEHAERVYDRTDDPVDAIVSYRGRTAYAVLLR